ncbi:MAG: AAA family ATPase [Ruminococcus flavefaciens]
MNNHSSRYNKVIKFYQILPSELIHEIFDALIPSLNREIRHNKIIKHYLQISEPKEKDINSMIAELLCSEAQGIFVDTAYFIIKDKISFTFESTDYNQFIASYNDKNKYYNTIFFFKWCLVNRDLYFKEFVDSELFDNILNGVSVGGSSLNSSINEILVDSQKDDYDTNDKPIEKSKEVHSMKLLGRIENRNTWYNFFPQYEYDGQALIEIKDVILKFPGRGGLSLAHSNSYSSSAKNFLENEIETDYFTEPYALNIYILEINDSDIEDNNNDDYQKKVDLESIQCKGVSYNEIIKKADSEGIYKKVTTENAFQSELSGERNIFLREEFLVVGEKVILFHNNKYYGPFFVKGKSNDGEYYIKTDVKNKNYLLPFYGIKSVSVFSIEKQKDNYSDPHYTNMVIVSGKPEYEDIIPDTMLLELLKNDNLSFESVINNPNDFIEKCCNAAFSIDIPSHIRTSRIEKLKSLADNLSEIKELKQEIYSSLKKEYNEDNVSDDIIRNSKLYKIQEKEIENYRSEDKKNETTISELRSECNRLKAELSEMSSKQDDSYANFSSDEIESLKEEIDRLNSENKELKAKESASKNLEELKKEADEAQKRYDVYRNDADGAYQKVLKAIEEGQDAAKIAFEPYLSSLMLDKAAKWYSEKEKENYKNTIVNNSSISKSKLVGKELRDDLVNYIKDRRNYSTNQILNIYICIAQNFITFFAGEPGTGKTSICDMVAEALGLSSIVTNNRYISVSVERGWSSKRDLIGYFNPLTKKFDKSNGKIYDALRILDMEKDDSNLPFLILLDEANLSPIEYYWADFMKIPDKIESLDKDSTINIGVEDEIFIPKTLRFVATVNSDQTTELLSPRLIDRSFIIKLPDTDLKPRREIEKRDIVDWKSFYGAFTEETELSTNTDSLLKDIYNLFKNAGMSVSPRIQLAITKYVKTAQSIMEDEPGFLASERAVDFAILQKLMPKINGYYQNYKSLFEELKKRCSDNRLKMTLSAIEKIENDKENNMGYCQYLT